MRLFRFLPLLVLAALLAHPASARSEGWSLKKLNPFARPAARKSSAPSTMQRLAGGTKKVVHGATDLVTLKWLVPKKEKPQSNSVYHRTSRRHAEKRKGSLLDYILPPKPTPPPETLDEWMSQKRMDP